LGALVHQENGHAVISQGTHPPEQLRPTLVVEFRRRLVEDEEARPEG
jgi:hypothetical protein